MPSLHALLSPTPLPPLLPPKPHPQPPPPLPLRNPSPNLPLRICSLSSASPSESAPPPKPQPSLNLPPPPLHSPSNLLPLLRFQTFPAPAPPFPPQLPLVLPPLIPQALSPPSPSPSPPCSPSSPSLPSFNLLISSLSHHDCLTQAFSFSNSLPFFNLSPDAATYHAFMLDLCCKSQVATTLQLLDKMLNKGLTVNTLTYSRLLNSFSLNRLRDAYKLLCRMMVKGCNPDVVHYNTIVFGFVRDGRPLDACKVLEDMERDGFCSPDLVTYTSLMNGLCGKGLWEMEKGIWRR